MLFSRKPDFVIPPGGISSVETLTIGGCEQTVLIQGVNPANPVLLFLHGGPSMPLPGVSSKGQDYTVATATKELVKHFVVVFWDQRGTGRSYSKRIPQDSMTVEQFVRDANELTDALRHRFEQDKIFLVGHSWGSLLGMLLIRRHPEKFHSYVGLSQIVNWTENDKLSYRWALDEAKRRGNRRALAELEAVGPPPYVESFEQWGVLRKWMMRFDAMVYADAETRHPGMKSIMMDVLRSETYSFMDIVHTFVHGFKLVYTNAFIQSLPAIDLEANIPAVEVPVTFIHGRKDVHVHGTLLERYYERLEAKRGKRLLWVERSSHIFHPDDAKLIESHLILEAHRAARPAQHRRETEEAAAN
ncbi:alpha/beta hydrolase [Paenibacillus sp.]|uniref:alpha/beta fold hydrolase n=1 Tax=Paenibacillus sp. TaxID=58172 RepID=UPI002D75AA5C|nr:alpha/beta hydrolase [Paenibacillus sp.]HZG86544.1 alpha/beta hydrolase [Paenibacillus sp.]